MIPKVAVVIVYENVGPGAMRPLQELSAPVDRHGTAERKLMGGRDIGKPCMLVAECRDIESLVVHRNWAHSGAQAFHGECGALIARVLDRDGRVREIQK